METKEMTRQVRLNYWAGVMQERTESGQNIRQWCKEKGMQEKTYFYWQRKLREAACEDLDKQEPEQPAKELSIQGFAEVKGSVSVRPSKKIKNG